MSAEYIAIFFTGLTVGGLTCMAVQGGLLTSVLAAQQKNELASQTPIRKLFPVLSFISTKLISHMILGALLGLFGQVLAISENTRVIIQILASVYMILVALNLLNIHPIFRYVIPTPPKFLFKIAKSESKKSDLFAPSVLGFLTIFIPCGTTLAMEALAISSGSPLVGMTIMGLFVLGTIPMFLGLGVIMSTLTDKFKTGFLKLAGLIVLILGLSSLNGTMASAGLPYVEFTSSTNVQAVNSKIINGSQVARIDITQSGYNPTYIQLQKDIPTKLQLNANGVYTCALAFRAPGLGLSQDLPPTGSTELSFTPTKPGRYNFSCSMGMYRGTIEVM